MTAFTTDRREMLAQILVLIGAPVTLGSLSACQERSQLTPGQPGKFFDVTTMAVLTAAIDVMIPQTATPGAVAVGVPSFIDALMVDWAGPTARAKLRRVIADLDAISHEQSGHGFAALDPGKRLAAVFELDRRGFAAATDPASADAYKLFKKLVFLAYSTSDKVMTSYVPNPGEYRGDLTRADYDALVAERAVGRS